MEPTATSPNDLTGRCLCKTHNEALSPLDEIAGKFFAALEACDIKRNPGDHREFLFSGHDLERWMLKTLAGMAASGNLMHEGKVLPGNFHAHVDLIRLLESPAAWSYPQGMYLEGHLGAKITREGNFSIAPIVDDDSSLVGALLEVQGLRFTFLAVREQQNLHVKLRDERYRPSLLAFEHESTDRIWISWEDANAHPAIVYTMD